MGSNSCIFSEAGCTACIKLSLSAPKIYLTVVALCQSLCQLLRKQGNDPTGMFEGDFLQDCIHSLQCTLLHSVGDVVI